MDVFPIVKLVDSYAVEGNVGVKESLQISIKSQIVTRYIPLMEGCKVSRHFAFFPGVNLKGNLSVSACYRRIIWYGVALTFL